MSDLSDGLIYEGGCHSLTEFIVIVPNLTHHKMTNWLIELLTD